MSKIPRWLETWWKSGDTGISSKHIAAVLSDVRALAQITEAGAPSDTSDVGRCVRLLDLAEQNGLTWRAKMRRMADTHPAWAKLVPRWAEIEQAYRDDARDQQAWHAAHPGYHPPLTRHRGKRAEAMRAIGKTFPPSRCWWLVATLTERYDPYERTSPHPFKAEPS